MCAIRHWSFQKGELFGTIAERYKSLLLKDVPACTQIIHFCCDRYSGPSLKSAEQVKRYTRSKPAKMYEVSEQFTAPDPKELQPQLTKQIFWASSVTNGVRMSNWSLFLAQVISTWVVVSKKRPRVWCWQKGLLCMFLLWSLHSRRLTPGSYSTPSTVSRMRELTELSYMKMTLTSLPCVCTMVQHILVI